MRPQLIEALTYPRLLVRQLVEEENYMHKSLFEATGERCHHCDLTGECSWANCFQDFRHFEDMTTEASVSHYAKASNWSNRCKASCGMTKRRAPAKRATGSGMRST